MSGWRWSLALIVGYTAAYIQVKFVPFAFACNRLKSPHKTSPEIPYTIRMNCKAVNVFYCLPSSQIPGTFMVQGLGEFY